MAGLKAVSMKSAWLSGADAAGGCLGVKYGRHDDSSDADRAGPVLQGKARLGTVVHMKNAAALALTAVKGEDQRELDKVIESARTSFNEAPRMSWGGGIMGPKSQAKARKRDKELQKEMGQRLG